MAEHLPNLAELKTCGKAIVNGHAHRANPSENAREKTRNDADEIDEQTDRADHRATYAGLPIPHRRIARSLHELANRRDNGRHDRKRDRQHQHEPPTAPELAVIVVEQLARHGRMDAPRDFARPSVQVAERDHLTEHRNEVHERQKANLAEPSRRITDVFPGCLVVFNLHNSAPFVC